MTIVWVAATIPRIETPTRMFRKLFLVRKNCDSCEKMMTIAA
jgi:hypothetical protein